MKDNTNTNRLKGRAIFLAAIMVISMLALPFVAGGVVATTPVTDEADGENETYDDYINDTTDDGSTQYIGQQVLVNVSYEAGTDSFSYFDGATPSELRVRTYDASDDEVGGSVDLLTIEGSNNSGTAHVSMDLDDIDTGLYALTTASNGQELPTGHYTFEVEEQTFRTVEFDDDTVTDGGAQSTTELEIDSRLRNNYAVNVSADGLSDEDLEGIFTGLTDENTDIESRTDIGKNVTWLDGPANPDNYAKLDEDEEILTILNAEQTFDLNFDDIDAGEYEFEFDVVDSSATATATIVVREDDADGEFSEGVYQETAGDIFEFEFELDDTDDAFVQIGSEDAGFIDVLYIEPDDADDPVSIEVNLRTLGSNASSEFVYNGGDNVDTLVSGVHDGNSELLNHNETTFAVDDDGDAIGVTGNFSEYLEELGLIDSDDVGDNNAGQSQLTRPLQATDYELTLAANSGNNDGIFVVDDSTSGADDELDNSLLELTTPQLGDTITHVAPSDDANEDDSLDDLLDVVTQREDIALDDRLIVQVEATGLYGAMINASSFDVFEDGTSADVFGDPDDDQVADASNGINNIAGEGIELTITADARSGNQEPVAVDLSNSDTDEIFVLPDRNGEQFFVIIDTDASDAFKNGEPRDGEQFTASLEYITDDSDRYRFNRDSGFVQGPFDGGASSTREAAPENRDDAYPFFMADSDASTSAQFSFEDREINFNNLNADGEIQAENVEDSEISGTTNIAPGTSAELRVSSTDASTSFRIGQSVNIDSDGSVSAAYDFSGQEVGDEFNTRFRASSSTVDTVDSVIVAEGDLGVEEPVDDEDDVVDDDDDVVEDDDDEVVYDDDDVEEPTDDETPGFGALVALVALIGAALLAARRQN